MHFLPVINLGAEPAATGTLAEVWQKRRVPLNSRRCIGIMLGYMGFRV